MSVRTAMKPEQQMTWRARAYMVVLALRHLGVGCFCLFAPQQFHGDSFNPVKSVLPLEAWGVAFLFIGVNALLALIYENEWWARMAITASIGVTIAWAAGFAVAGVQGMATAPIGPIVWGSLALKDLVVAAMPLRSPFEHLLDDDRAP
ncbi:MAG TPA: hypothetical protein VFA83_15760 [Acidimicrobiales bacterium]|nr:hypothetical protein [Acidimicrobiales bacterium]